jgi:hypothetical protein
MPSPLKDERLSVVKANAGRSAFLVRFRFEALEFFGRKKHSTANEEGRGLDRANPNECHGDPIEQRHYFAEVRVMREDVGRMLGIHHARREKKTRLPVDQARQLHHQVVGVFFG